MLYDKCINNQLRFYTYIAKCAICRFQRNQLSENSKIWPGYVKTSVKPIAVIKICITRPKSDLYGPFLPLPPTKIGENAIFNYP